MDINQMMRDPSTVNCRVYVGNTKEGLAVPELTEHFSKHGTVLGVTVNRGFAFIQFDNEASAAAAIKQEDGALFQGRKLVVRTAVKNADKAKAPYQHPPQECEVVGGKVVPQDLNRVPRPPRKRVGKNAHFKGAVDIRDRSPLVSNEHPGNGNPEQRWGNSNNPAFPNGNNGRIIEPINRFNPQSQPMQGPPQVPYHSIQQPDSRSPGAFSGDSNDCEIIVFSRNLTQYAEAIEGRLKRMGLRVDLLYPNEDVPVGKLLSNIVSRGCLYAMLVGPINEQHRSVTVNILHGDTTEHRNMPVDDALDMINEDFHKVMSSSRRSFPPTQLPTAVEITPTSIHDVPPLNTRHPDAIQTMVNLLASNRPLTVLQYDRVIAYLQERRELQLKAEIGDAAPVAPIPAPIDPALEIQKKIMDIMNKPSITTSIEVPKSATSTAEPNPVPAPTFGGSKPKLLSDPKIQKALDSLITANLFD